MNKIKLFKMKHCFTLMGSVLLLFSLGCNEEPFSDPNGINNFPPSSVTIEDNFGSITTGDFMGQVIDPQHVPISNATVQIGTSTTTTDENGDGI